MNEKYVGFVFQNFFQLILRGFSCLFCCLFLDLLLDFRFSRIFHYPRPCSQLHFLRFSRSIPPWKFRINCIPTRNTQHMSQAFIAFSGILDCKRFPRGINNRHQIILIIHTLQRDDFPLTLHSDKFNQERRRTAEIVVRLIQCRTRINSPIRFT